MDAKGPFKLLENRLFIFPFFAAVNFPLSLDAWLEHDIWGVIVVQFVTALLIFYSYAVPYRKDPWVIYLIVLMVARFALQFFIPSMNYFHAAIAAAIGFAVGAAYSLPKKSIAASVATGLMAAFVIA